MGPLGEAFLWSGEWGPRMGDWAPPPCLVSIARLSGCCEFSWPSGGGGGRASRRLGEVLAMRGSVVDEDLLRLEGLAVVEGAPDWEEGLRGVTARRDHEPSDRTGASGEPPPQKEPPLGELGLWPRPDSFCWYMLMPLHPIGILDEPLQLVTQRIASMPYAINLSSKVAQAWDLS